MDESQKKNIVMQIESRLGKNLDFFMRFDKEAWINEKKLILTDSGKCFHIRLSVAVFPKKRYAALKLVKGLFSKNKVLKIPKNFKYRLRLHQNTGKTASNAEFTDKN